MAEAEVSLCGGRVVLAGFSHAQIRLVYLISSLSLFSMYTMSTLTPHLQHDQSSPRPASGGAEVLLGRLKDGQ